MNKNSRIFRRAAWVAVLALMLQVVMPLLHPVMAASAAMSPDSGMRHCSMSSVASGSVDKSDPGKTPQQKSPSCPICMSMHVLAGGYVPPQPADFIYVARDFTAITPASDVTVASVRLPSSAQPRAPPFLA